ncbi:hypothetical protein IW261DRAFT_1414774 [Armillaria novae-zelandiae]|uniref:Uncharacterized protein n=1 Tax=Armillaria novae-zelandiae TaxID=153914 RepID=A0AA39PTM1_9AGAR|nr:hypothetical protein IW261DRAFT_1414774 [Armillaria novae-zelandiae]
MALGKYSRTWIDYCGGTEMTPLHSCPTNFIRTGTTDLENKAHSYIITRGLFPAKVNMCQESRCPSRHAPSKSGPLGHIRSYHRYRSPIQVQPIPRLNEEQPTQNADPRKIPSYVFHREDSKGATGRYQTHVGGGSENPEREDEGSAPSPAQPLRNHRNQTMQCHRIPFMNTAPSVPAARPDNARGNQPSISYKRVANSPKRGEPPQIGNTTRPPTTRNMIIDGAIDGFELRSHRSHQPKRAGRRQSREEGWPDQIWWEVRKPVPVLDSFKFFRVFSHLDCNVWSILPDIQRSIKRTISTPPAHGRILVKVSTKGRVEGVWERKGKSYYSGELLLGGDDLRSSQENRYYVVGGAEVIARMQIGLWIETTSQYLDRSYLMYPRYEACALGRWEQRRTDVAVPDIMKGTHDSGDRNYNISSCRYKVVGTERPE